MQAPCDRKISVGAAKVRGRCRTSTASARSQWALPDPNLSRERQFSMGIPSARCQWALPDPNLSRERPVLNGHYERQMSVGTGTAGPQPRAPDLSGHCRTPTLTASASSDWALPDPNRERSAGPQLREPDLSGHCRTSIANARCHIECQPEIQIECQKRC